MDKLTFGIWLTLESVAFVLSAFGNSVVIYVMTCGRRKKSKTNLYITSVAVSDMLVSIMATIFTVLRAMKHLGSEIMISKKWCICLTTVMLFLISTSIIQVVSLSIDRYWAICHAFSYRNKKVRFTKYVITACWVLGALIGLLHIIMFYNGSTCLIYAVTSKVELNYFNLLSYIIVFATFAIMVLYAIIYKALLKQVRKLQFFATLQLTKI